MNPIATDLVRRLKARDEAAWYELYRVFGPAVSRAVNRFGHRRFTPDTVRDLTQETLCEAARCIQRFDPDRGTRFSTWLLSVCRFVVYGEVDRRMALKRGQGQRPGHLDAAGRPDAGQPGPEAEYRRAIFRAKVYRALESVAAARPMLEFEAYRLRLTTSLSAREMAHELGVSEPSISRYLRRVRDDLRREIQRVVAEYSFTDEELSEVEQAGLDRASDRLFDRALSDIYLEEQLLRMGTASGRPV